MVSIPQNKLIAVVGTALATHALFRSYERFLSMEIISLILILTPVATAAFFVAQSDESWPQALLTFPVYYTTLLVSVIAYRLSPFHPLAKYPGPISCKISKLWTVYKNWNGRLPQYHKRLHDKYGPIVRTGPNELSVVDKDLLPDILGSKGMPKGPLWDGRRITPAKNKQAVKDFKHNSLISNRDLARHAQLRKPWNRAFGSEPLQDYTESLTKEVANFVSQIESRLNQRLDMAQWISYFSFDLMGNVVFGKSFDLLKKGDILGLRKMMDDGVFLPAMTMQVPWAAELSRSLPWISSKTAKFGAFAVQQAITRAHRDNFQKDLFFHIADRADSEEVCSLPVLVANSVLAVIAGADTTNLSLCNAIYYLLSNPEYIQRLREELAKSSELDVGMLEDLPWLNAIINETLRLQPPVPTALQRAPAKGSGGKMVGDHFIAEGTAIQVSPYVLHRDPAYFAPYPETFWPDRWILHGSKEHPEIILEQSAYIPFSMGPANCVGKRLAMREMRYVLANLFTRFDIEFASGWDASQWERGLADVFTLATTSPLFVLCKERNM